MCVLCVRPSTPLQEIYNEELRDLLGKGPPKDKKHAVGGACLMLVCFLLFHGLFVSRPVVAALRGQGVLATHHQPTWGCFSQSLRASPCVPTHSPACPPNHALPHPRQQVSHDKEGTTVSYLEYFDVSQPERVAALLERAMKARRCAGGWTMMGAAGRPGDCCMMLVVMLGWGCHDMGSRCWQALALCKRAGPAYGRPLPTKAPCQPCRSVGATAMNEQSSRSHMVFILAIEGSNEGTGQKVKGALLSLLLGLRQDSVLRLRACLAASLRCCGCSSLAACNTQHLL